MPATRIELIGAIVPLEGVHMLRWLYLAENAHLAQTPALSAFWSFIDEMLPDIRLPLQALPAGGNGRDA